MMGPQLIHGPVPYPWIDPADWVDPTAFDDTWAYPWAYPVDAGVMEGWEGAITNPQEVEWPVHYDPTVPPPPAPGFYSYGPHHYTGAPQFAPLQSLQSDPLRQAGTDVSNLLHRAYGTAQDLAHTLGQGIAHAPGISQIAAQAAQVPRAVQHGLEQAGTYAQQGAQSAFGVLTASDKISSTADTVANQANQIGDDARRTLAVTQASIVDASKHIEDTAKQTQSTAKTIEYVVLGIGALATVAILFHIIKQSSE